MDLLGRDVMNKAVLSLVALATIFAAAGAFAWGEQYEEDAKIGGGGAPQKLLLDNTRVRVNLVSFLKDFDRMGGLKRRNDQLLVYIDPGAYEITRSGDSGKEITPDPAKRKPLAPGSAVFHGRDSVVSSTHIYAPYRVIFLEVK
jgi:hypothetical protein